MTATSAVDTPDDERGAATPEADGFSLPFAWEHGPHASTGRERDRLFRFPHAEDQGPGARRLLAMSVYTALVGLLALAVTVRGILAIISDTAPGWYQPTFFLVGLIGFVCIIGGFLSVHRRALSWLLLGLTAVPLAINVIATLNAT